ncbi:MULTISPECIES: ABC transporter permease [unclassified Ensifer]|uniref:ABC transporter permease n=1 Tax=unclassified Ensifer TaxID=2633371 RepID=UPI000B5B5A77|nr:MULTISPECIES: ABC transporter permease subunit [unclassified Ensifer]MBD9597907.1 ABC transporter permease subunit [Ensifer sp. ENS05]MBD9628463.1 ABC transporter permease subunit [Ensifer sp. ENS06]OWZ88919.1 ABC transporter [Sinorhizobium sp. LM21]
MFQGYLPMILGGLRVTLSVASVSLAIACVIGLIGASAKVYGGKAARLSAAAYTTTVRALPDLLVMLVVFYGGQILLNSISETYGWGYLDVDPYIAGVSTIGFVFGAYLTETFRGAILSVPAGQIEAGFAYGLSRWQVAFYILLPQMIRHAVPGLTNTWLVMLKATALVSIIGLDDMVHRAGLASAATREPFTFYALIGLIYLAVTTFSVLLFGALEKLSSRGVRSGGTA